MYDVQGWDDLVNALRNKGDVLERAAYMVLTERTATSEPQIERVELEALPAPDDPVAVFRPTMLEQVLDRAQELRDVAVQHTPAGSTCTYRIMVWAPKGDSRLYCGAFHVQRMPVLAQLAGGGGSHEGVTTAMAHGMMSELTGTMRELQRFVAGMLGLMLGSSREVFALHRLTSQDLQSALSIQGKRIADLEDRYHLLIDKQAEQRLEEARQAMDARRAEIGQAMFKDFVGAVEGLGEAYIAHHHPELVGLDGDMRELLRVLAEDPEFQRRLKDPALRTALQDESFRRDFGAIISSVADSVREQAASKTTAGQAGPAPETP